MLSKTEAGNPISIGKEEPKGNIPIPSPKRSSVSGALKAAPCDSNEKSILHGNPDRALDEMAKETKELEQPDFIDFNNKHLSVIREESEDSTLSTPPPTPISTYPQPLPIVPSIMSITENEKHPPVKKLFSVDVLDDDQLKRTLDEMPQAPTDEPKIQIKPRNPQLYQLCQMNSTSSFWWDSSTDSNDEFGFNFRSDGVPANNSACLSPAHPVLTPAESVTSYYFGDNGRTLVPVL